MSADPRTEAIARARGPHLYAMRHTPSGGATWAAWRLEVAGILHEAELATPLSESVVHVAAVVDALAEVGELAAADYVREVFDVGARLHHGGDVVQHLVLDEATETLQPAPSVPVQPAGRRTHRVDAEHPNVLTGPWGRS